LAQAERVAHVAAVSDPFDPQRPMISPDQTTVVATISFTGPIDDPAADACDAVLAIAEQARGGGLRAEVGGSIEAMEVEIGGASEIVGVILSFVVLMITFGSLAAAGANILVALIGVVVG